MGKVKIEIIPMILRVVKKNKIQCVGRESNPGQLLGRQLCSPLYHRRFLVWVRLQIRTDDVH